MKEISELSFPEDLRYARDHEWVRIKDGTAFIGISDYAQDQLGDIVYVELPAVGKKLSSGAEFGVVESVKAVSELYMPVGGEIVSVNKALEDTPEKVNTSPYDDGWMIEIRIENLSEIDSLLTKDAYLKMLKG
ncbi:MAG: glycine cleavage system protein GcvH [Thermodesulfobacteriota bacterium]